MEMLEIKQQDQQQQQYRLSAARSQRKLSRESGATPSIPTTPHTNFGKGRIISFFDNI